MKEQLRRLVQVESPQRRHQVAQEYLQARILLGLQRVGAMIPLAFHGGTALRFLHDLDRFSEDLDFALEHSPSEYEPEAWMEKLRRGLATEGYEVEVELRAERIVHAGWVRFPGLPQEIDRTRQASEKLRIKLEIDTRPPGGAGLDVSTVRRHALLRLQHHDRPTLLSGKLHALLSRPYAKGRDIYDLVWYLSDRRWPKPNLEHLRNALKQTDWPGEMPTAETWRGLVAERLREFDWQRIRDDVAPFLENPGAADWLTLDDVTSLLEP